MNNVKAKVFALLRVVWGHAPPHPWTNFEKGSHLVHSQSGPSSIIVSLLYLVTIQHNMTNITIISNVTSINVIKYSYFDFSPLNLLDYIVKEIAESVTLYCLYLYCILSITR